MVRSNGVMLVHWLARGSFASSVPSSSVYWWVFGGRYRTFRTGVWHNSSVLVGNYTNTNNVCKKSWHRDRFMELIFNIFRQKGGQDIKVTLELSFMEAVQGCVKTVSFQAEVTLELSFMEAVQGCVKTVSFQAEVACEACSGSGVPPGTRPESFKRCKGSGMTFMQTGPFRMQTTCSQCGGTGKTYPRLCNSCNGRRVTLGMKSVKFDIMPGVDDNETIKVYRSGGADPDGMQPGDLYVTIKVREDPAFCREGADIHVHAGTQPGQKVVLKKNGIKTRNSYSLGDQYVHSNVSIPTNLTQRQRELIEEFGKEEDGEYSKCAAAGAS